MEEFSARVNKVIKEKADNLFESLGIDTNTAINMFLEKCVKEQAIPFKIREINSNEKKFTKK